MRDLSCSTPMAGGHPGRKITGQAPARLSWRKGMARSAGPDLTHLDRRPGACRAPRSLREHRFRATRVGIDRRSAIRYPYPQPDPGGRWGVVNGEIAFQSASWAASTPSTARNTLGTALFTMGGDLGFTVGDAHSPWRGQVTSPRPRVGKSSPPASAYDGAPSASALDHAAGVVPRTRLRRHSRHLGPIEGSPTSPGMIRRAALPRPRAASPGRR